MKEGGESDGPPSPPLRVTAIVTHQNSMMSAMMTEAGADNASQTASSSTAGYDLARPGFDYMFVTLNPRESDIGVTANESRRLLAEMRQIDLRPAAASGAAG